MEILSYYKPERSTFAKKRTSTKRRLDAKKNISNSYTMHGANGSAQYASPSSGAKPRASSHTNPFASPLSMPSFNSTYANTNFANSANFANFASASTSANYDINLAGVQRRTNKKQFAFLRTIEETLAKSASFWVLVIVCAVIFFALVFAGYTCAGKISSYLFEPVALKAFATKDTLLVNNAMKNFLFSRTALEAVAENGDIISDGTATEKAARNAALQIAYTKPVTFSEYTVQKNDNITSITKRFGLTNVSTLIAINNIENVRRLRTGQKLKIPSIDGLMYTVKASDTLESISSANNLTIEKLVDVNDLASSTLTAGQVLFIPGAKMSNDALKKALGELFICPLAVSYRLTSAFGPRADPFTGVRSNHTGIDMAAPLKTPVRASAAGKVSVASYSSVYGNYVVLTHNDGYQTLYAHLYSANVKAGQKVAQGEKIGLLGNTGYSTGAHLHFTVYKNGKLINPFEVLK